MGRKVNGPFVVLLAAIVGMASGAYLASAGPPLRELSTYRVASDWKPLPMPYYDAALDVYIANRTAAIAACAPGDAVTGGGHEFRYDAWPTGSRLGGHYEPAAVGISAPDLDLATGREGWRVEASYQWLPGYLPKTEVRAFAICLHWA